MKFVKIIHMLSSWDLHLGNTVLSMSDTNNSGYFFRTRGYSCFSMPRLDKNSSFFWRVSSVFEANISGQRARILPMLSLSNPKSCRKLTTYTAERFHMKNKNRWKGKLTGSNQLGEELVVYHIWLWLNQNKKRTKQNCKEKG